MATETVGLRQSTLPRKPQITTEITDTKKCVDFKTISLIPHASKMLLKILTWHLQAKADDFLGPGQYGFTCDAIVAMRVMCKKV